MYNKKQIEIVDYFKYLGVPFTPNGKFTECRTYVVNQARKAMYLILKKARIQKLPIDVQLDLFHNMVLPILFYSSEEWGIENKLNAVNTTYIVKRQHQLVWFMESWENSHHLSKLNVEF